MSVVVPSNLVLDVDAIVRVGLCGTVDCYWNLGLNLWGIELGVEFVVAEELP